MGSLGWVDCDWCGDMTYGAYLMDGGPGALCETCFDACLNGERPPKQPDGMGRCALLLLRFFGFPEAVCDNIAGFLVWPFMP